MITCLVFFSNLGRPALHPLFILEICRCHVEPTWSTRPKLETELKKLLTLNLSSRRLYIKGHAVFDNKHGYLTKPRLQDVSTDYGNSARVI